jgi:hypothetical protein
MTVYPVEFHRRFEQKWAHRAELVGAPESAPRPRRFVRQYCNQGTKPERERVEALPLGRLPLNRSQNA